MILGNGIDVVDIERCHKLMQYTNDQLARYFSPAELAYCRSTPIKSAERLAARLAAKEALLKALQQAYPMQRFSLYALCRATEVKHLPRGVPALYLSEQYAQKHGFSTHAIRIFCSISHTKTVAYAHIIVEQLT